MKYTKSFEVEFNLFDTGTMVTVWRPTSGLIGHGRMLEYGRAYKVIDSREPMYPGDPSKIWVWGYVGSIDGDCLVEVDVNFYNEMDT